jgi:hypothetical protein
MDNTLLLFGALMLVHLLYDFHWQGDFIGVLKSDYDFLLHVHCLTWTLCISAVLYYFGVFAIGKFLFLYITHFIIDYWKCRLCPVEAKLGWGLWLDQSLHLFTLIVVVLF